MGGSRHIGEGQVVGCSLCDYRYPTRFSSLIALLPPLTLTPLCLQPLPLSLSHQCKFVYSHSLAHSLLAESHLCCPCPPLPHYSLSNLAFLPTRLLHFLLPPPSVSSPVLSTTPPQLLAGEAAKARGDKTCPGSGEGLCSAGGVGVQRVQTSFQHAAANEGPTPSRPQLPSLPTPLHLPRTHASPLSITSESHASLLTPSYGSLCLCFFACSHRCSPCQTLSLSPLQQLNLTPSSHTPSPLLHPPHKPLSLSPSARLTPAVHVLLVHAQHAVHLREVQAHASLRRLDVPFERGAGAKRNEGCARLPADPHHAHHFLRAASERHRLRREGEVLHLGRGGREGEVRLAWGGMEGW